MYTTFSDIIDYVSRVIFSYGASHGVSASRDQIRTAIRSAYNELPVRYQWRRYTTLTRLSFAASQTYTANYDADEGTLTLDGGTWPDWAENCSVSVGGYRGCVGSVSDETATLSVKPDSTVASGSQTVILYNDACQLPADYLLPVAAFLVRPQYELRQVNTATACRLSYNRTGASIPHSFGLENIGGENCLRLYPAPSSACDVDLIYRRRPTELVHSGRDDINSDGTITVSTTTVTGVGTSFRSDMVGCVLRIGTPTMWPTDRDGLNPFLEEKLISSVKSTSSLTIDSECEGTYSGVMYCVTSLLDVDPHMYELLAAMAVQKLAQMMNVNVPIDVDGILRSAIAADAAMSGVTPISGGPQLFFSGRINYT